MKIGFDAKRIFHNATGLGNYSRDAVRILSEFYSDNQYVLYNPKEGRVKRFKQNKTNTEVKFPEAPIWKKLSSVWRQGPIVKQLQKDGIEIFHGLSNEIPKGLEKTSIKSVVTIHDLIFIRYPHLYKYFDRKIHYKKFKYAAENADIVIAISEQTKQDIMHYFGIPEEKIEIVYQGCSNVFKEEFSEEETSEIRKTYNLPEQFVLSVGTIEERKNLLTVVKALKGTDIPLVVVGKQTAYYDKVVSFIEENNMQNQVIFLKDLTLRTIAGLYQMATIFVYPSIFEGFGIPVIEALYSKTPVITSNVSCLPEAAGPHSILIDPTSETQMKDTVLDLWNNEEKRKEIVEKSHVFVQKFNDEEVAKNLFNVYQKLK
ncbi:glycosyltransferase family 4 protein [Aureivirga sp. CE67]|uniref:glycosyltransferase family 4 protein n=1 Tax=Aureivirga sp. CE67 TaxID=1788983 RepID=UPI0018CA8A42|nr:glycosyltransferase family 1 protein [Aureivirga sp. CE67]